MFSINIEDAEKPIEEYNTLCEFFTRKLRPDSRKIDQDPQSIVSPVDGRVSAFGVCEQDRLIQVKDSNFKLFELLRDESKSKLFENGVFATLYLSPSDYHRIHAPLDIKIHSMGYMPGNLLPVHSKSVRWVPGLYTQNERIMIYADSKAGQIAMIFVGAHCVGSIKLSFDQFTTNQPGVTPLSKNFEQSIDIRKGEELGMFEMGSTVILLFEPNRAVLELPESDSLIHMGDRIGNIPTQKRAAPRRKNTTKSKENPPLEENT